MQLGLIDPGWDGWAPAWRSSRRTSTKATPTLLEMLDKKHEGRASVQIVNVR